MAPWPAATIGGSGAPDGVSGCDTDGLDPACDRAHARRVDPQPHPDAPETFNPWTVVNLVFNHLAEQGLHPVLGDAGDPAEPAAALLRAFGIEPGRNDESVTSPAVQDTLADLRARMFPDV
jgi:hypothetical protein